MVKSAHSNDLMKVQNRSQRSEPDFGLNYLQSKDALMILRLFIKENYQAKIAKYTGFDKRKVNYWTHKFIKCSLIDLTSDGRPKFYQSTALGLKILTRSERELGEPVVLEDYAVKYRLVKDHGLIDWEKLGEPRNWVKLGIMVGGRVRVVKNGDSSIIVHPGKLQGFGADHLLVEVGEIIEVVLARLQSRGVEIEPNGVPLHKPIFHFCTPEAEVLNQYGTVTTENGALDNSRPEKEPHVEFRGIETARNYIDMPNRLKRVEVKVDDLQVNLRRVVDALDKVSDPLTKLANLVQNQASEVKEKKRPEWYS
jgi:hypothetical protein